MSAKISNSTILIGIIGALLVGGVLLANYVGEKPAAAPVCSSGGGCPFSSGKTACATGEQAGTCPVAGMACSTTDKTCGMTEDCADCDKPCCAQADPAPSPSAASPCSAGATSCCAKPDDTEKACQPDCDKPCCAGADSAASGCCGKL